jgi:hypothetical protein
LSSIRRALSVDTSPAWASSSTVSVRPQGWRGELLLARIWNFISIGSTSCHRSFVGANRPRRMVTGAFLPRRLHTMRVFQMVARTNSSYACSCGANRCVVALWYSRIARPVSTPAGFVAWAAI